MSLRAIIFSLGTLAVSTSAVAQVGPSPLLDEAISKTREMAFRSNEVDWYLLEPKVRSAAADAEDVIDLLNAFEVLVEGLGDGHSFVNVSAADRAEYRLRYNREFDESRPQKVVTSTYRSRREPEGRRLFLNGGAPARLVTVPMILGGGTQALVYANALFAKVVEDAHDTCGFIVDLRGNQGGNIWPMVAGLSPLLGQGWRSFELGSDGITTSAGYLENGAAIAGEGEYEGQTIVQVDGWKPYERLSQLPVAVLIDDAVASSGEGVAVGFKGRPGTQFFGQTTYGAASSNEGFLIDDRVNIVVTTGMMVDRDGRTYPTGISPDTLVVDGPGSSNDPDDAMVEAAKIWLAGDANCGAVTTAPAN